MYLKFIVKLLLIYGSLGFIVFNIFKSIESSQIYFPYKNLDATPQEYNLNYEDIYFSTKDDIKLHGWYIYPPKANNTILFFHGNAGNISHRMIDINRFYSWNNNVFIFDYRGYGKSHGSPSEDGLYQDALAAYQFLIRKKNIDADKIIFFGRSLGGALAINLALTFPPKALISESAFTSIKDMAKNIYPFIPSWLISSQYDSLTKIKNIKCPKLILHSVDDEIVPFEHGQKLFNAASFPKTFFKMQGGHNEGLLEPNNYPNALLQFIESLD